MDSAMEQVPTEHITGLEITPDLTSVAITVNSTTPGQVCSLEVFANSTRVVTASCTTGVAVSVHIPSPVLWWPSAPCLYNFTATLASGDSVGSYFGLRTFSVAKAAVHGSGSNITLGVWGGSLHPHY